MTPEQEAAGLSVMRGTFKHKDVRRALHRAGVPIDKLESATSSLLQRERKAGNILHQEIEGKPADENDRWVRVGGS